MPGDTDGDSNPTLYCSFCGKSQLEVRTLVAGAKAHICPECITACMDEVRDVKPGVAAGRGNSESNSSGRGPGGASE